MATKGAPGSHVKALQIWRGKDQESKEGDTAWEAAKIAEEASIARNEEATRVVLEQLYFIARNKLPIHLYMPLLQHLERTVNFVEGAIGKEGEVAAMIPGDGALWKKSDKVKRALHALAEEVFCDALPKQGFLCSQLKTFVA